MHVCCSCIIVPTFLTHPICFTRRSSNPAAVVFIRADERTSEERPVARETTATAAKRRRLIAILPRLRYSAAAAAIANFVEETPGAKNRSTMYVHMYYFYSSVLCWPFFHLHSYFRPFNYSSLQLFFSTHCRRRSLVKRWRCDIEGSKRATSCQ